MTQCSLKWCTRETAGRYKRCEHCRDAAKRGMRNFAARRIAENRCTWCGNSPLKTKHCCAACVAAMAIKHIARRRANRLAAMDYYGGAKCNCCGESELAFLAFDHVNGGGNNHIKSIKRTDMGTWLVKNNFPDGFQVLCHNCNFGKALRGVCPHQEIREKVLQWD